MVTPDDIKAARDARGWSQAKLAEMAGVNLSTVWRWEQGKIPKAGTAKVFLERFVAETEQAA